MAKERRRPRPARSRQRRPKTRTTISGHPERRRFFDGNFTRAPQRCEQGGVALTGISLAMSGLALIIGSVDLIAGAFAVAFVALILICPTWV